VGGSRPVRLLRGGGWRVVLDGKLLGLPVTVAVNALDVNLTLAREAGIAIPAEVPDAMTIDEFTRFALILGDNIFYGAGMSELLQEARHDASTTILAAKVKDPERFGVVTMDDRGQVIDLEEKPKHPKSDLAITGIYFFYKSVFQRARKLRPSNRNELEITDLVKTYWKDDALTCIRLPRGSIWFDTGTPDSLLEAANLIQMIQKHQGFAVGNPHEIAYNKGWIEPIALRQTAQLCEKSAYGQYLLNLLES
jgi:glucose-1-phosphate thymidylyltransferase